MGYLLGVAVFVILVVLVIFALSAAMLLVGRVLGLLFPITTFAGALITTLVALGVILAFLLGYVGRIGDDISHALASLQEEDEEDEEYPRLRLAPDRREGKPISRNAPCPCGSGKKYKRCCLDLLSAPLTIPLVCCDIKRSQGESSGSEAMARRRK